MQSQRSFVYTVWDTPTRWFHWINALCVLTLMVIGLGLLNGKALGLSDDGKVLLKTVHVWVGYLFVANLLWRLVWAFVGNRHARWRAFLPAGRGFGAEIGRYLRAMPAGRLPAYVGHNPLGRVAVTLFLLLLLVQAASGLILAGTDLFYPPFGSWIAQWVAAPGVDPGLLRPYHPELLNQDAYAAMRALRAPVIDTHEMLFFVLAGLVLLHVGGVIHAELRQGGSLVSAMITGRKTFREPPVDAGSDRD